MEEKDRETLEKCRHLIVRDLIVDGVLPYLRAMLILTGNDEELVRNAETNRARAEKLLDILTTRGPTAFKTFCQALREANYGWIAALLCGEPYEPPDPSEHSETTKRRPSVLQLHVTPEKGRIKLMVKSTPSSPTYKSLKKAPFSAEQLLAAHDHCERHIAFVEEQRDQARAEKEHMRMELAKCEESMKELDEMTGQLSSLENNLAQCTSERNMAMERVYVFEREKDRLQTELNETLEELKRTRNLLAQATTTSDENTRIRNLYMDASIERDMLKQSLREQTNNCEELQAKVESFQRENTELRTVQSELNSAVNQLKKKLREANIQATYERNNSISLNRELKRSQEGNSIKDMLFDTPMFHRMVREKQKAVAELEKALQKVKELGDQCEVSNKLLEHAESKSEELQRIINELQRQFNTAVDEGRLLKRQLQSAQLEMNGLRQVHEELSLHQQDLEKERVRMMEQVEMLRTQYRQVTEEFTEVQQKYETVRENQAELVQQMIRENEEHSQAYAENGKLKGKLTLAEHSKRAANEDLTVAKKNVVLLERQLHQLTVFINQHLLSDEPPQPASSGTLKAPMMQFPDLVQEFQPPSQRSLPIVEVELKKSDDQNDFGLKLESQVVVAGYSVDCLDTKSLILPGDRILKINGLRVTDQNLNSVEQMLADVSTARLLMYRQPISFLIPTGSTLQSIDVQTHPISLPESRPFVRMQVGTTSKQGSSENALDSAQKNNSELAVSRPKLLGSPTMHADSQVTLTRHAAVRRNVRLKAPHGQLQEHTEMKRGRLHTLSQFRMSNSADRHGSSSSASASDCDEAPRVIKSVMSPPPANSAQVKYRFLKGQSFSMPADQKKHIHRSMPDITFSCSQEQMFQFTFNGTEDFTVPFNLYNYGASSKTEVYLTKAKQTGRETMARMERQPLARRRSRSLTHLHHLQTAIHNLKEQETEIRAACQGDIKRSRALKENSGKTTTITRSRLSRNGRIHLKKSHDEWVAGKVQDMVPRQIGKANNSKTQQGVFPTFLDNSNMCSLSLNFINGFSSSPSLTLPLGSPSLPKHSRSAVWFNIPVRHISDPEVLLDDRRNSVSIGSFNGVRKVQLPLDKVDIKLTGGRGHGIFVVSVHDVTDSRQIPLKAGDHILQLGEHDLCYATYEQAILAWNDIKKVNQHRSINTLSVTSSADHHPAFDEDIVATELREELVKPAVDVLVHGAQDRFMALPANFRDAFFIRVGKLYNAEPLRNELHLSPGDLLHVVDTFYQNKVGFWRVHRISEDGKLIETGCIPCARRAQRLPCLTLPLPVRSKSFCSEEQHSSDLTSVHVAPTMRTVSLPGATKQEQISPVMPRRRRLIQKIGRKIKGNFTSMSGGSFDTDVTSGSDSTAGENVPNYEVVERCLLEFARPVVLIGLAAKEIGTHLLADADKVQMFVAFQPDSAGEESLNTAGGTGHDSVNIKRVIKVVQTEKKHCLFYNLEPSAVESFHKANLFPIVVQLRSAGVKSLSACLCISEASAQQAIDRCGKLMRRHDVTDSLEIGTSLPNAANRLRLLVNERQNDLLWLPSAEQLTLLPGD